MRPEYYGDLYRRYQTYIRNYGAVKPIKKIACGANAGDFHWTEKVLETCFDHSSGCLMDGLSLHYYTIPNGRWEVKGSSTDFDEKSWYQTLSRTLYMETLIKGHGAIMDKYDPDKKIGMMIDEWGTWYDVEPGTNPGFLYQQNTMRDALVAAINLNLFNKHCDRVKMANIAQLVNVLQSVILTEGDKMVKTPTYHVFNMYKYHQDGELLESSIDTASIGVEDDFKVPNLTESVSVDATGKIHVTLGNLSATESYDIEGFFAETPVKAVKADILTDKMQAHNTFDAPETVKVKAFDGVKAEGNKISLSLPACSVMHIEVTV
jgi:alpha-N-arabinofuranosidase